MGLGPIMAIYQARFNQYLADRGIKDTVEAKGLGLPRRRRMRRAGNARRDHARLAREARQPDLRHQLQPAAARRPGARQRQDHSRARRRSSAAPAGTSSRSSGATTGIRCSSTTRRACSSSGWAKSSTASTRSTSSCRRRLHSRALLRQVSRTARDGRRTTPTRSSTSCAAAATIRRRSTPPTRRRSRRKGQPTVILAKTIKGYGLGEAGEGRNIAHNQKKLNEERAARVPHAVRHSDLRRRSRQGAVLQAGRTTARR